METFECLMLWVFIIGALVAWYVNGLKKYNTQAYNKIHYYTLSSDEKAKVNAQAEKRQKFLADVSRPTKQTRSEIAEQYLRRYNTTDADAPWIKPEYRAYFKRDLESGLHGEKAIYRYCACFAQERMVRDHAAIPLGLASTYRYLEVADPEEYLAHLAWETWWNSRYPTVIDHFNRTGEFLLPSEWKPLKEIPDWNDGRNTVLQ